MGTRTSGRRGQRTDRVARATLLLGGLAVALTVAPGGAAAQALAPEEARTIRVSAVGEASAPADEATLRFAVETRGETAQAAARENAAILERVIAALVAAGVPRAEIETQGFSVFPEYDHRPRPEGGQREPEIVAYRATNQVSLTTQQLDELGTLIDTALAAGANRFEGVQFGLRDAGAVRARALREAVEQARAQAGVIAAALDVPLGAVLDASTGVQPAGPRYPATVFRSDVAESTAAPTPIQPGGQTVRVQVSLVYAIGAR